MTSVVNGNMIPSLYNKRAVSGPLRILFIKPYQSHGENEEEVHLGYSPPLGLITIVSTLRERFGEKVDVKVVDMKVLNEEPELIVNYLREFEPHFLGASALNCEISATHKLSQYAKEYDENIITVLGGPYSLHRAEEIFGKSTYDWIFNGAADFTFPEAVSRVMDGEPLAEDIVGFSYRKADGSLQISSGQDHIKDLDSIPMPAWELIDFDLYAKKSKMGFVMKGTRYATLTTSRGCPYLCNYCHDLFSKKYEYQSVERVIAEIELLYETYGVDEFQIVDDIFNLHKPRLKEIFREIIRRWEGKLKFNFPNGVRADILDEECIELMCRGGTYWCNIAIETVTPRLQDMVEKYLDYDKAAWTISEFDKYKCGVTGFFMLGFPTETVEEMEATIKFALGSPLTIAHFFTVNPQPGTPIYPVAQKENPEALAQREAEEGTYTIATSWYEYAYGYPLAKLIQRANYKFFLHPKRIWRIWCRVPKKNLFELFVQWTKLMSSQLGTKSKGPEEAENIRKRIAEDQAAKNYSGNTVNVASNIIATEQ